MQVLMEQAMLNCCQTWTESGEHLKCVKLAVLLLESHPASEVLGEVLLRSAHALDFSPEVIEVVEKSHHFLKQVAQTIPHSYVTVHQQRTHPSVRTLDDLPRVLN